MQQVKGHELHQVPTPKCCAPHRVAVVSDEPPQRPRLGLAAVSERAHEGLEGDVDEGGVHRVRVEPHDMVVAQVLQLVLWRGGRRGGLCERAGVDEGAGLGCSWRERGAQAFSRSAFLRCSSSFGHFVCFTATGVSPSYRPSCTVVLSFSKIIACGCV